MSVDHLLVHRCTVQRLGLTDQGHGRFAEAYAPLLVNRPCRVSMNVMQATERIEGAQQKTYVVMTVYFAPGTNVARNDKITGVIREDGTVDPAEYRVTAVVQPSLRHHIKVSTELIQQGE